MKTNNRYQGDPAVKITENGATMTFKGGQPIMDQGFHNAVLISLFTKKGWWGNTLAKTEDEKIGSDFEDIRTIVDIQTLNDYRDSVNVALKWMKTQGIAKNIEVEVTNPYLNQIRTSIKIQPPGETFEEFLLLNNGTNWIGQALHPVSERI